MGGYRSIHAEQVDSRLEDFVRLAQQRIRTARLARASLQGLAAAATVFLLCEISRVALAHFGTAGSLPTAAYPQLLSACVSAAVLVLWISVAAIGAVLFAPDRSGVARLADRQLRLDERLSTALEIGAADGRAGPDALLGAAVVNDAQARIRTLDPGALARPWFSPWIVLAPVAILLALFVPAGGALLPPNAMPATATSPQLTDAEKAQVEQALQQVAELTNADATQKKSAYLGAVARTADALKSEVANGSLSRQEVSQTLGQLMSQTAGAYGDSPQQTERAEAEQTLSKQLLTLQAPPAHPSVLDKAPRSQQPAEQPLRQSSQQQAKPPQPDVNNPEKPSAALKDPPRSHLGSGYDQAFSTFQQPRQSPQGAQMTLTEQQQVEAAENAYSGGVTPGDGTRPLGGGSPADGGLDDLLAHDSGQLALPPPAGNEGERISIKVAPPTETSPADAYSASGSDAWTSTPDQAVARHVSHAWERDILARYFRPDQDDQ